MPVKPTTVPGSSVDAARSALGGATAALLLLSSAALNLVGATAPPSTNAVSNASTNSAPIPIPEIAVQIEAASATLQALSVSLEPDPSIGTLATELPVVTREINARLEEGSRIITWNPSLGNLRRLDDEWRRMRDELSDWNRTLSKQATHVEKELRRLADLHETWQRTESSASAAKAPAEVLQHIKDVLGKIKQTRDMAEAERASILVLQNRVAEQHLRVVQAVDSIERARSAMLHRLFIQDTAPIWSLDLWAHQAGDLLLEGQRSLERQMSSLAAYGVRKADRFVLHAFVLLVLVGILLWTRRRVGASGHEESGLRYARVVVQAPYSTAVLLAILASGWFYPQAPRLLWALLAALGLIPATRLLGRLVDPRLIPILAALVIFFFLDELRAVTASQTLLPRCLLLAETLVGALVGAWLLHSDRLRALREENTNGLWKAARIGTRVAVIAFGAAFLANTFGYQGLSNLVCNAVLNGAYLALILFAGSRIADSLVLGSLGVPPFSRLDLVNRYRAAFHARVCRIIHWLAVFLWVLGVLEALALRGFAFQTLKKVWLAEAALGSHHFAVGEVFLFAFTVWAAFFVSRVVQFALQEEVYPRVQLAPGLHYSISRMLHYAVLLTGFFIGLSLLGVNLTQFTILAGAFGVGVGFGLQNIINNFVSGIILLFERPVKVGDLIQMEGTEGVVKSIGIRASVVRTVNGSEIVIPNGKLISDPLTNWSFSNRQRLISIPVSVAADTQPQRVIDVLKAVAADHPQVIKNPAPQVLLTGLGAGSLNFELRAWTSRFDDWPTIRSDLSLAVNSALATQKITIR